MQFYFQFSAEVPLVLAAPHLQPCSSPAPCVGTRACLTPLFRERCSVIVTAGFNWLHEAASIKDTLSVAWILVLCPFHKAVNNQSRCAAEQKRKKLRLGAEPRRWL